MDIKDQLRIRMEELQIPTSELAKRIGASQQTVRYWLSGRNFPGKARTSILERELSFKLDFNEGDEPRGETVAESLRQVDIETFIDFQRLPPHLKHVISTLTRSILELADNAQDTRDNVRSSPPSELTDSHGYPSKTLPAKRRL